MKLLTKEILNAAPAIGAMDGKDPRAVPIVAKYFTPWSSWSWFMTEYDPATGSAFGFATDGNPMGAELGYFDMNEMAAIKGPFGLAIERDLYFDGTLDSVLRANGKAELADALIDSAAKREVA